jgi:hypothetical protein
MKTYGELEKPFHTFYTLVPDTEEQLISLFGRFTPEINF